MRAHMHTHTHPSNAETLLLSKLLNSNAPKATENINVMLHVFTLEAMMGLSYQVRKRT